MGILNVTPDSFSDGGLYLSQESAYDAAINLIKAGVDILDIGGQSTRPGAVEVGAEEELRRVLPVLKEIRTNNTDIIISIDTYLSKVAQNVLEEGADWINDISAGKRDERIFDIVAQVNCPYVITHSRGNSLTMDSLANYDNVIEDVCNELKDRIAIAKDKGISSSQIIVDPGLGFAKDTDQNLSILRNINRIKDLGYPILLGPSRKRFIGDVLKESMPENRIWGSVAIACRCVEMGIELIRVHDVHPIVQTLTMAEKIR